MLECNESRYVMFKETSEQHVRVDGLFGCSQACGQKRPSVSGKGTGGVVPDFKDRADVPIDQPTWRFGGGKR